MTQKLQGIQWLESNVIICLHAFMDTFLGGVIVELFPR